MTKSILFVDDEEHLRKIVATHFGRRGYEVITAENGEQALQAIARKLPDIVVADVNMPRMDGFELTRRLRSHPRTASLPIVILSALKKEDQILGGYQAGADDYVTKPVEMSVLGAKIDALLRRPAQPQSGGVAVVRGQVVTFLHAKGGVGTTTLLVNVAVATTVGTPERALIVEATVPTGDAAILLDLHPARSLADVPADAELDGETLGQLAAVHSSGVSLIAAPPSALDAERVTGRTIHAVLEAARAAVDYVFVDTSCGFSEVTLAAIDDADTLCLVTEPHLSSILATKELLGVLQQMGVPVEKVRLVINRTTPRGVEDQKIFSALPIHSGTVVPYSEVFWGAADEGRPLSASRSDSAAAFAIHDLMKAIQTTPSLAKIA